MILRTLARIGIFCTLAWGQQLTLGWQEDVRRLAAAQDWGAAMRIVDREISRAPRDMDVRTWRARILTWSGSLAEAEHEYGEILAAAPNDPDNWMGLATVYTRQGRTQEGLRAVEHAVQLDSRRPDLLAAYGRLLRTVNRPREAKVEFQRALELDPHNAEAQAGLRSLHTEPRHEMRVGVGTDFFNFTDANHDEGVSVTSDWTAHWRTNVGWGSYQRAGTDAEKFIASVTGKLPGWGALTLGGATARDNSVIPKCEAFFEYDHGRRLSADGVFRGLEVVYGQHWYWYTTARILTINGSAIVYLPREWTWALALNGAQSDFYGTGVEWRPAGLTRLGFPIAGEAGRLKGNVFFAVGTENFAQLDQIGRFSSRTVGAGLRFRLTATQEVAGFTAYQMRSQDRKQTSLGFTYAVRF